MNRTSMLLLFLLVASNLAWLAFGSGPPEPADRPPPPPPAADSAPPPGEPTVREREMASEIADLRERLAHHEEPAEVARPEAAPVERSVRIRADVDEEARAKLLVRAGEISKRWFADLKQIDDASLRARAIEEVRVALTSDDEAERLAALWSLGAAGSVEFDRASFRPLVTPQLESEVPAIRLAAVRALAATEAGSEGIPHVLPLLADDDPEVLKGLARALVRLSNYRPDPEAATALVRLLSHSDHTVVLAAIDALKYVRELPPGLEDKLVEIATSKDYSTSQRALYALGGTSKKSERVIDLLLPHLGADNWNARLVAYQSLTGGVPESAKKKVADAAVRAAPKLPDYNNLLMIFRILNACGDASHLEEMERLANNPMLSESVRKNVERWLEDFRRKVGG